MPTRADELSMCAATRFSNMIGFARMMYHIIREKQIKDPVPLIDKPVCPSRFCPRAAALMLLAEEGELFDYDAYYVFHHGAGQKCSYLHSAIASTGADEFLADVWYRWLFSVFKKSAVNPTKPMTDSEVEEEVWRKKLESRSGALKIYTNLPIPGISKELLNARTSVGLETPLILAVKTRSPMVEFLFTQGADITARDALGMRAVDWVQCGINRNVPRAPWGEWLEMLTSWDNDEWTQETAKRLENRVSKEAGREAIGVKVDIPFSDAIIHTIAEVAANAGAFNKHKENDGKSERKDRRPNMALVNKWCPPNTGKVREIPMEQDAAIAAVTSSSSLSSSSSSSSSVSKTTASSSFVKNSATQGVLQALQTSTSK